MKPGKRKLSPVALSVLVAAAGILVLVLGLFVLVLPQKHAAADTASEAAAIQHQIVDARLAAQPKARHPIDVADLFKVVKAMPDDTDMPGILLQLDRTARDAGIEFDSITPQAPVASTASLAVPIDLEFTGTFYELDDFLFRMRNLVAVRGGALDARGRLFTTDTLSLDEATAGFPRISAKLRVTAFVYGSGAATGATGSTATSSTSTSTSATPTTPTDGTSASAAGAS